MENEPAGLLEEGDRVGARGTETEKDGHATASHLFANPPV